MKYLVEECLNFFIRSTYIKPSHLSEYPLCKTCQHTGSLPRILLYMGKIYNSVLIRENTGQQNLRFCPYMGKYRSEKTHILAYFTQRSVVIQTTAEYILIYSCQKIGFPIRLTNFENTS